MRTSPLHKVVGTVLVLLGVAPVTSVADADVPSRMSASAFQNLALLSPRSKARIEVSGVPIDGRLRTLSLERFDVFTPDVWIDVHGEDEGRHRGERPAGRYYRGGIQDDPESVVFVAIDGYVSGIVHSNGRLYEVVPVTGQPESLTVRETEQAPRETQARCATDELASNAHHARPSASPGGTGFTDSNVYDIRVAIETDYEFYSLPSFQSEAAFTAYVGRFVGAASAIYNKNVKVNLSIGYLSIWTTPNDPWTKATGAEIAEALVEVADYWHTNRIDVPRSMVHFLSAKPFFGGVADQDTLCSPDRPLDGGHWAGAYAVTGGMISDFGTDPESNLIIFCHETGHVIGSPHTHCYDPPVDHCFSGECYIGPTSQPAEGATIMSYCYTNPSYFLGRVGQPSQAVLDLIRSRIEAKASCLTIAPPCTVTATPLGSTTFSAYGSDRGYVDVSGDANCPWTATSNAEFLTIYRNNLGSGPLLLQFSVAPNPGPARTGTLTVAGQTITVTQLAMCIPGGPGLCLYANRFQVTVSWTNPYVTPATTGVGNAYPLTSDTGAFWFFDASNVELVVKVLDGRSTNGKFWVFYGALSDVAYTLTVLDTFTGAVKTYVNEARNLASKADLSAF